MVDDSGVGDAESSTSFDDDFAEVEIEGGSHALRGGGSLHRLGSGVWYDDASPADTGVRSASA